MDEKYLLVYLIDSDPHYEGFNTEAGMELFMHALDLFCEEHTVNLQIIFNGLQEDYKGEELE